MKTILLNKNINVNGSVITSGTKLCMSNEGFAEHDGIKVLESRIPVSAIATESDREKIENELQPKIERILRTAKTIKSFEIEESDEEDDQLFYDTKLELDSGSIIIKNCQGGRGWYDKQYEKDLSKVVKSFQKYLSNWVDLMYSSIEVKVK